MYVAALVEPTTMLIYSFYQVPVVLLINEKIGILAEYSDFSNVFSSNSAAELPEYTRINDHPINLLDDKQPPYGLIYSLGLVELETLKTYIKANLASGFIRTSKSLANTLLLFVQKKNGSLRLYVDYQRFNKLTIKNCYLLLLISELLNYLGCAKYFTQLDLINAYHQIRIQESDKQKTVFQIRNGYFEYQVMLFSFSNIFASFQGYVNKILAEKLVFSSSYTLMTF